MKPLDDILAAARRAPKRIVLSEGEDPRIAEAAVRALQDGIAHPVLIGRRDGARGRIHETARKVYSRSRKGTYLLAAADF